MSTTTPLTSEFEFWDLCTKYIEARKEHNKHAVFEWHYVDPRYIPSNMLNFDSHGCRFITRCSNLADKWGTDEWHHVAEELHQTTDTHITACTDTEHREDRTGFKFFYLSIKRLRTRFFRFWCELLVFEYLTCF